MTTEQGISTVIAIASAITILVTVFTPGANLLRENSKPDSKYSFSKFQLWLWTLVVCPCTALHWGFQHDAKPFDYINATSLILLAISGSTTLTSTVIKQVQLSNKKTNDNYLAASGLTTLKTESGSRNFWSDILSDDYGQLSIARLQNLVFTLIFVVIYTTHFFINNENYIDFGASNANPYILMGISSGTYLFARGMFK